MGKIMIQGTTSSAGKSILVTALCRILLEDGYRTCPFKSQNMSNRYFTTKTGIMSTAQVIQARAAKIDPDNRMNPIFLLPNSNTGSRVYILGKESQSMEAREYFKYRSSLKPIIKKAYEELASNYDLMIVEGAGSPAEINLRKNDIVNMGLAELLDLPVILIADIDRGGVFASLYGTVMLLEEAERSRIKGLVINRFRGDKTLLDPGIKMIEELLNIPVVGIIPYMEIGLADEDSLVDKYKKSNEIEQTQQELEEEIRKIAGVFRENLDMKKIYEIMDIQR